MDIIYYLMLGIKGFLIVVGFLILPIAMLLIMSIINGIMKAIDERLEHEERSIRRK